MVYLTLALRAASHILDVFLNLGLLLGCGKFVDKVALRCQYHESNTEHGVGTGSEDGEGLIVIVPVPNPKLHLCTLRPAYPVLLCLLDGVAPVDGLQSVEQTLGVGADAEAPLAHLLLLDGEAAAHTDAIDHLVVGKHGAQSGTPVYHRLAHEGYAVVHEFFSPFFLCHLLPFGSLLQFRYEFLYRLSLLQFLIEVAVIHLLESPLRPLVVARVAGAHLAVPVEREAYLVQLLTVAVDVLVGSNLGVLSRLNGILLCRQSVGIVAHRVEYVVSLQTLVACIDVAGDVAQGVSHMESCSRWIWEHVEHVELLLVLVLTHLVGLVLLPV